MAKTYYELLKISENANDDDIKKAYKSMALKYHPDKAGSAGSTMFILIQQAKEVLLDPKQREEYDTQLRNQDNVEVNQTKLGSFVELDNDTKKDFLVSLPMREYHMLREYFLDHVNDLNIAKDEKASALSAFVYVDRLYEDADRFMDVDDDDRIEYLSEFEDKKELGNFQKVFEKVSLYELNQELNRIKKTDAEPENKSKLSEKAKGCHEHYMGLVRQGIEQMDRRSEKSDVSSIIRPGRG